MVMVGEMWAVPVYSKNLVKVPPTKGQDEEGKEYENALPAHNTERVPNSANRFLLIGSLTE